MTSFSFCRVVSENIHASTEGKGLGLANEEVPNPIRILFDLMAQTRMMSPILCSSPLFWSRRTYTEYVLFLRARRE